MSDEATLWKALRDTGDQSAREQLILRYVPLVRYVLGRLGLQAGPEYEDLVSQGLIGLIEAVDRFDPERGTRFSTFAIQRIRGQMIDALRSMDLLSRPARQRVRALEAAAAQLQHAFGRTPTEAELANQLGTPVEQIQQTLADASLALISLDSHPADGDDLYSNLPDESQEPPDAHLVDSETRNQLQTAIQMLPTREQQLLALYYFEGLTMKEIGAVFGVSESRVSQIHARTLLGLRTALKTRPVAVRAPLQVAV